MFENINTTVYSSFLQETYRKIRYFVCEIVEQYITEPLNRVYTYMYSVFHKSA